LNYGASGRNLLGSDAAKGVRAPFDFQEYDEKSRAFVMIVDKDRRLEIGRQISPVYHVSPDDPPTFIMHGDADVVVPLQQSQIIMEKLREAKVPCELVVKPGGAHGWLDIGSDVPKLADWFDKHLAKK
jgi:dipeptidyl aminopeptidase/acylaminoacyl peptidase